MGDRLVSEEFDVAELFRPAAPKGRRRVAVPDLPWYPAAHLTLAVVTAAVVWLGLGLGAPDAPEAVRVGATTVAAVVSLVVWVRFGPLAAVVTTVVVGLLCAGAGTLALYAPVALAVVAVAAVVSRALRRRQGGER